MSGFLLRGKLFRFLKKCKSNENMSSDRQDILATAAYFPDSAAVHTPRDRHREWSGTREHLSELAQTSTDDVEVQEVIKNLSTPRMFEEMELSQVDGIVIENGGKPVVHLQTNRTTFETMTIDVDDVQKLSELVDTVKARERRRWVAAVIGVASTAAFVRWWWRR
jgi:hypothetical protein